jgi:hypothetical protein
VSTIFLQFKNIHFENTKLECKNHCFISAQIFILNKLYYFKKCMIANKISSEQVFQGDK